MRVECRNIIISRTLFERNMKDVNTKELSISINSSFATNKDLEKKEVRLTVEIVLGEKKAGNRTPFYSEFEIMGFFEWDDIKENDLENRVMQFGLPIIMSFARVKLYELCQQAGLSEVILPELAVG